MHDPSGQIHFFQRNTPSMMVTTAKQDRMNHKNAFGLSCPGSESLKFIPKRPVRNDNGIKIVAMIVSTFITSFIF